MNFKLTSPARPYFEMTSDSEPLPDKSCIIFAPNGVGKTTICKNLVDNHRNEIVSFSYSPNDNQIYKKIEGKQKYIVIDPTPVEYVDVHAKCESLRADLSTENAIGTYFSNKKTEINKLSKCFKDAYDAKILSEVEPLNSEQRLALQPLLCNCDDLIKAIKDIENLKSLAEKEKNEEINALIHSDIATAFSYLHLEEHKSEIEKNGCPFCGGTGRSGNPYSDMMEQKALYAAEKIVRFRDYKFVENIFDAKALICVVDGVLAALSTLTDKQIITLLFSKGDSQAEQELVKKIKELSIEEKKETRLITDRNLKYNTMKDAYLYINQGFADAYPGCSIHLDDEAKTIKITTPRSPSSYSEGEKHDMYSKLMQLSVLGSTKEYLLVDDPLTELDAANEYKLVFSFVKLSNDDKKKVIIFTCNANLVNIAVKQCGNKFDLFYLESSKDNGGNIKARLMKMDFGEIKSGEPYLTLGYWINGAQPTAKDNICKRTAYLIGKRAQIDLFKKNERTTEQKSYYDDASKCLHYDNPFSSSLCSLSNDELFSFANSFSCPKELSFINTVEYKICLLASLRVFVEKKLYLYDNARINKGFKSVLINVNYLKDKIEKVDKVTDFPIKDFYPNWNKKALMQMKTMLNDGDHPFGLVQPLFFAISIGWDNYSLDVDAIKHIFANS